MTFQSMTRVALSLVALVALGCGGSSEEPTKTVSLGANCTINEDCGGATGARCVKELSLLPISGAGALGAILRGVGASVNVSAGYCTMNCMSDADCGSNGVCVGSYDLLITQTTGTCRLACTASNQCGQNQECAQATTLGDPALLAIDIPASCLPLPEPRASLGTTVGQACTEHAQCGTNGTCNTDMNTAPGGYCQGLCVEDSECGTGGICVRGLYGSAGSCFLGCTQDTDCTREEYGCTPLTTGSGAAVQVCGVEAAPLPAGVVGSACTDDTACAPGTCLMEIGQAQAPGGYCSQTCAADDQCGGGSCVQAGFLGGICASNCPCRTGYVCNTNDEGVSYCLPGGMSSGSDAGMMSVPSDAGTTAEGDAGAVSDGGT